MLFRLLFYYFRELQLQIQIWSQILFRLVVATFDLVSRKWTLIVRYTHLGGKFSYFFFPEKFSFKKNTANECWLLFEVNVWYFDVQLFTHSCWSVNHARKSQQEKQRVKRNTCAKCIVHSVCELFRNWTIHWLLSFECRCEKILPSFKSLKFKCVVCMDFNKQN